MPDNHRGKYHTTLLDLVALTGNSLKEIGVSFKEHLPPGTDPRRIKIPPKEVRSHLQNRGVDYSFKIIAHINLRGGIGKTTSSITTASRLGQYGFKTCILDLDPQGSASLAFNFVLEDEDPVFYDVWQKPDEILMGSLRQIDDYLYLLPSSLENSLLDSRLSNPAQQKNAVRGVCEELKANGFDMAIIDCPPSLGSGVISSICAADIIVIPIGNDPFSFRGLELTLTEIQSICETFGLPLPEIKILFSKFDRREKMSTEALNLLDKKYKQYFIPFVIRTSTEFSKALSRRETVFASTVKNPAKEDYDNYVKHLFGLDRVFNHGNGQ